MSGATFEARCPTAERTQDLAARLGALLRGGEVIALVGDLGSGKTTFTRGLCRGAGLNDARLVSSPTYVLEHIYPAPRPIHHYDAYRLSSPSEFQALGFEEHIAQGEILIIEWADRVLEVLPAARLLVEIALAPGAGPPRRDGSSFPDLAASGRSVSRRSGSRRGHPERLPEASGAPPGSALKFWRRERR